MKAAFRCLVDANTWVGLLLSTVISDPINMFFVKVVVCHQEPQAEMDFEDDKPLGECMDSILVLRLDNDY